VTTFEAEALLRQLKGVRVLRGFQGTQAIEIARAGPQ
jgi:hypothetical protein